MRVMCHEPRGCTASGACCLHMCANMGGLRSCASNEPRSGLGCASGVLCWTLPVCSWCPLLDLTCVLLVSFAGPYLCAPCCRHTRPSPHNPKQPVLGRRRQACMEVGGSLGRAGNCESRLCAFAPVHWPCRWRLSCRVRHSRQRFFFTRAMDGMWNG